MIAPGSFTLTAVMTACLDWISIPHNSTCQVQTVFCHHVKAVVVYPTGTGIVGA